MDEDDVRSELLVLGYSCSDDDITTAMGIQPTKIIHPGDAKSIDPTGEHPPVLYDQNAWVCKLNAPKSASVEEHIGSALRLMESHKESIQVLSEKYHIELSVYGSIYDQKTGIHFHKDLIKKLAYFGVELDISIYNFSADALDSDDKKRTLIEIIQKLNMPGLNASFGHDEAVLLVDALAMLEIQLHDISEQIVPSLFTGILDKQDKEERVEKIVKKINELQQVVGRSKALSNHLQQNTIKLSEY